MKKVIIKGVKNISELIENPELKKYIKEVFLTDTQKFLIDLCKKNKIPFVFKNKKWFEKNGYEKIFCLAEIVDDLKTITIDEFLYKNKDLKTSLIVALDKIQDPHNFGVILRTCAAANVDAVIFSKHHQAQITTAVLNVSRGGAFKNNLILVTNLKQALEKLQKADYWSYSTIIGNNSKNYTNIEFSNKSILIIGNEGDGVSSSINKFADFQIQINMDKSMHSLNVSVATGILIFEFIRQKNIIF